MGYILMQYMRPHISRREEFENFLQWPVLDIHWTQVTPRDQKQNIVWKNWIWIFICWDNWKTMWNVNSHVLRVYRKILVTKAILVFEKISNTKFRGLKRAKNHNKINQDITKIMLTKINLRNTGVLFCIWVFLHEHSRITGLQGKGRAFH